MDFLVVTEIYETAKKKMRKSHTSRSNIYDSLELYSFPRLHEGKSWYVDFYFYDPATVTRRRKKISLDGIKSKVMRRRRAMEIINRLCYKLSQGWNPFAEVKTSREYIELEKIFSNYEDYVNQMTRTKTRQNYLSRLGIFRNFLAIHTAPPKYAYQFNKSVAIDFLDFLRTKRMVSARTYNNYRGWLSSFCEYMVSREYLKENIMSQVPKLRIEEKRRQALTKPMLHQLFSYLKDTDKYYLLACMMEYYTFIRPTELSHLKIGDISVKNQSVFVSAKFSKNRTDGSVGLTKAIVILMLELGVLNNPMSYYLFGKDFKPGERRYGPDTFNHKWKKIRQLLGWPDNIQFYSLKDSGIRDLANSRGIVVARDQARHSDISTTNKYLSGRDRKAPESTKDFVGALSDLD